jgi:catechol 2,3-dioxygenase-like lactoylglutathione lyase family enzyme
MKSPGDDMLYGTIDHFAIACHDTRKVSQWYCRHLGMRVIAQNQNDPPTFMVGYDSTVRDGAMIELMPARDSGPEPAESRRFQPGVRHLALRVSDFEQAYTALKAQGVTFLMEPTAAIGGGKLVSFRDVEGNELQIIQR